MIAQPPRDIKCFTVSCSDCGIEETMMFQSKFCKRKKSKKMNDIFLKQIPYLYNYLPADNTDDKGNENIIKPVKTLLGDKLPVKCPKCGSKLKIIKQHLYN